MIKKKHKIANIILWKILLYFIKKDVKWDIKKSIIEFLKTPQSLLIQIFNSFKLVLEVSTPNEKYDGIKNKKKEEI